MVECQNAVSTINLLIFKAKRGILYTRRVATLNLLQKRGTPMISDYNPSITLCTKIAELRRAAGMTQDSLAEKLGVTYQAVSKWENALSCPDIALIPVISDIFGVSIDTLFGKETKNADFLPWNDDGVLRAVLYEGTRLLSQNECKQEKMKITLELEGNIRDVKSEFNVICQNVAGTVNAGELRCDSIAGNANAGSITCDTIEGDAHAGALTCDIIEGDAKSGAITCDVIEGDVSVNGGGLTCNGEINGDVNAENCKITVNGDLCGDARLEKSSIVEIDGDVNGNIDVCGAGCTITIDGDVNGDIDVNAENAVITVNGELD